MGSRQVGGRQAGRTGCGKVPLAVILSGAKDLHLLVSKKKLQMLRSAQHDRTPRRKDAKCERLFFFATFVYFVALRETGADD